MSTPLSSIRDDPERHAAVVFVHGSADDGPVTWRDLADRVAPCRASLHQEIENFALIVDCAPEPNCRPAILTTTSSTCHRRWPRTLTAKFSGEQRPELQKPLAQIPVFP
jgi:hypothetical protein